MYSSSMTRGNSNTCSAYVGKDNRECGKVADHFVIHKIENEIAIVSFCCKYHYDKVYGLRKK